MKKAVVLPTAVYKSLIFNANLLIISLIFFLVKGEKNSYKWFIINKLICIKKI